MYAFDYTRPASLADAAKLLQSDSEATLIAGGQTLMPTLRQRLSKPSQLVSLSAISGLFGISQDGNALRIGAMTTHATIAADALVQRSIPGLAHLASLIGDPQVRHRGTIGGSLANNDPSADWPAAALALGATIETNTRKIAADDYFQGIFLTALESGEIITAITFPIPEKAGYAKFEQRASRFALVGVCVAKTATGVRAAVTGTGETGVFRSADIEQRLAADFSTKALAGLSVPDTGLLSDLHGSAAYRAALIPVMAERAVEAAG